MNMNDWPKDGNELLVRLKGWFSANRWLVDGQETHDGIPQAKESSGRPSSDGEVPRNAQPPAPLAACGLARDPYRQTDAAAQTLTEDDMNEIIAMTPIAQVEDSSIGTDCNHPYQLVAPAEAPAPQPKMEQEDRDRLALLRAFEPPHSSRIPKAAETLAKIRELQAAAAPAPPRETQDMIDGRALASALKKMVPEHLLMEVIDYCDPLGAFLKVLSPSPADTPQTEQP